MGFSRHNIPRPLPHHPSDDHLNRVVDCGRGGIPGPTSHSDRGGGGQAEQPLPDFGTSV